MQHVRDEVLNPVQLFGDACNGSGMLGGCEAGAHHFGGQGDDAKRIFEVVNNRTCKTADGGEAFGLDNFPEVMLIKFAQPMTDKLQERASNRWGAFNHGLHGGAIDKCHRGGLFRGGTGGPGQRFNDGHLAKNLAGFERGKHLPPFGRELAGNLNTAGEHNIKPVAGIAFAENFLPGRVSARLRGRLRQSPLGGRQLAENFGGVQINHAAVYAVQPWRKGKVMVRQETNTTANRPSAAFPRPRLSTAGSGQYPPGSRKWSWAYQVREGLF